MTDPWPGGNDVTIPEGIPWPSVATGSEYDRVAPDVGVDVAGRDVTAALDAPDDPKPDGVDPVGDAPELSAPPPGSPVNDGVMVTVAVGNIVVVMTVLVIMVVGPLKIIVLPSPKISICVAPGMYVLT
jgi:hypothetical protein